jgi:hypothetical protein
MTLWNAVASQHGFVTMLFVASVLVQVLSGVRIFAHPETHAGHSRAYRVATGTLVALFGLMLAGGLATFLLGLPSSKLAVVLVVCGASGVGVFGHALLRRHPVDTNEMRTVIARDL